jgi:outer membrane murein-binding lipoprotein Lpp
VDSRRNLADTFPVRARYRISKALTSTTRTAAAIAIGVSVLLLSSCATAELERLDVALSEARAEVNALSSRVEKLENRNRAARERAATLERELEQMQARLSTVLELTGTESPEAAVQEIESLLQEVESLRELIEDQAFARSLLEGLPSAPRNGPEEATPSDPPPEPARPEAPAESAAPASAGLDPRVLAGFIQVDEIQSTYIGEADPLPEDPRLAVTRDTSRPRIYLPRSLRDQETTVAPVVFDGEDPQLAIMVKVTYPASEAPLYLQSVEVTGAGNAAQVALLEVRRQTTGSLRMEEAIVTNPATVRTLTTLLIAHDPPRLEFHGNARSVQKKAPQELRGDVAAVVYTFRALGGEVD